MSDDKADAARADVDLAVGATVAGDRANRGGERDGPGIEAFVPFFKAFCNSTRAGIVEQLLGGERCVCELTADVEASQPLVSHHLAVLRGTGFVRMREEGTRTYYSIDWERFDGALDEFRRFVTRERSTADASCVCR
ncbi:MAG TPA: metalloregulator ArsR/SmtB family transcription factor [Thermoleophilia bacterium]|nr:metalloregulator ArsR/SmtB family transcription factor [Thermoleophilia bacterium]